MPSTSHFRNSIILLLGLSACSKDSEPTAETPLVYTTVGTLAGSGISGFVNGSATVAQFSYAEGLAADAQGNVYVAEAGNACIRKITPAGVVSTFAGDGTPGLVNGPAATARFSSTADLAFDPQGNLLVADYGNNCIRKITPGGIVSTLAGTGVAGFVDGPGTVAQFSDPEGLAIDAQGTVYVSEYGNYSIRKVLPNGTVSTVAGTGRRGYADGPGRSAQFVGPEGLALDAKGTLYVADFAGHRIRKITADGVVSTLAGTGVGGYADGDASTAKFYGPVGIAFDAQGNLIVADAGNYCIRKITPAGTVSVLAGTRVLGYADGPVGTAQFNAPAAVTTGARGVLYVAEYSNHIRKITAQ